MVKPKYKVVKPLAYLSDLANHPIWPTWLTCGRRGHLLDSVSEVPVQPHRVPRMTLDQYLDGRLHQYQNWYDRRAAKTKALHLRVRTIAVLGGVVVPVLINLGWAYAKLAATVVSVVVASVVSLESVYHYREQWKNYRSAEQMIGHERIRFETRTGIYRGMSDDEAFATLVDRVEDMIASENAATLNAMAHGTQIASDEGLKV